MWGLGNEMEGSGDNPVIWRTVNEIARIAKADPDHPTMTVIAEAGGRKIPQFMSLCPDVDVLGINSYAGLPTLPKRLAEAGLDRPYVITEFGPPGPWEVRKTGWGGPVEPTSTEKARIYLDEYSFHRRPARGRCLGSYAFLWGHKQEATATWFGMFLPSGERLGAVDAMTFAWTGRWPANRVPELSLHHRGAGRRAGSGGEIHREAGGDRPGGRPHGRSLGSPLGERRPAARRRPRDGAPGAPGMLRRGEGSGRHLPGHRPGPGPTGSSPTSTTARGGGLRERAVRREAAVGARPTARLACPAATSCRRRPGRCQRRRSPGAGPPGQARRPWPPW